MLDDETTVRGKFVALRPVMDERLTRLWAGAEADALGDGGIAIVERATGLSRTTIRAGRDELRAGVTADDVVGVRRAGGGRSRIEETSPGIVEALETLVDPVTRGDPESPLRWTSKSTRKLAAELSTQGFAVSPQKVGQLLDREWLQPAGDAEDAGGDVASRSERAIRVHQRSGRCLPRPRGPGHLGGYEEERARRRVSEPRARMAAEWRTRARPRP